MQKTFALISLWTSLFAGLATAQTAQPVFLTGQAARAVIGQTTFVTQNSGGVNGVSIATSPALPGVQTSASDTVFGGIGGLAYAANTLFAGDNNRLGLLPNNNRVLIFNNIGQTFPLPTDEIPAATARCPLCGGQANVIVGQPDTVTVAAPNPPTSTSLRLPLGVASDGKMLAIADTSNNRVLLWKSIPTTNGQAADIVLGQPDFVSFLSGPPTASSLRGPQGVWLQNGKLFVADTGDNRILIWNSIPTANNKPADLVLGQPNFTSGGQFSLTTTLTVTASIMASPTSVTSDGTHLFVSDLGFSRVLIWNSLPTSNMQPADVEIGQLDMAHSIANDSSELCASNGVDTNNNPTYPATCLTTLNFPRFALSDGTRLFVADGGNDRVMVYNTIPTTNAAPADAVLGQPDEFSDVVTSTTSVLVNSNAPLLQSAANVTPTPTSLAWDGTNLYVADPSDYRILVFTPAQPNVPITGIVNAASRAIFAQATVVVGGTITAKDTLTLTINTTAYTYTILSTDTLDTVAQGIVNVINAANSGAGDPNVLVYDQTGLAVIVLVARAPGANGNSITIAESTSTNATITATNNTGLLTGGGSAGQVAPGTLISINGTNLADATVSVPNATQAAQLPFALGGVEVYFDGDRAPLLMVSSTQINAQVPWEIVNSNSTSVYVRTTHQDGSVTVTNAIGVPMLPGAPGIFAADGPEPRVGQFYHSSSFATGVITLNASVIQAGDTGTIIIGDRPYTYTVQATDTLPGVVAAFVGLINSDPEASVTAAAAPDGVAVVVTAKTPGPDGNGILLATNVTEAPTIVTGALLLLTAANSVTCCANVAGRPVTAANPAVAGETVYLIATGLGIVCMQADLDPLNNCLSPDPAKDSLNTGAAYTGPAGNVPLVDVNVTFAGSFLTIVSEGLEPGTVGLYRLVLQLPNTLTANPFTQLFIQQSFTSSNIVTLPVGPPLQFSGQPPPTPPTQ